ncbi:MAG: hypothetical protein ACRETF_09130 [Nevskiaceae bacterium]
MRVLVLAAMVAAAVAALPAEAQKGKKVQCWTDKSGQRMCGDRIPPEYAGEKREVMQEGRVVDTISASKSEEERQAELAKKKEAEGRAKAVEYDRTLLEMYRSQSDITAMRDERIALIDLRVQALEKNASDTDKGLAGLRARAEAAQAKEEPPDEQLAKRIRQFEKSQTENTKALERNRKERDALQAKFEKDYGRYSELRGLPPGPMPPPKAAKVEAAPGEKPATPATPVKKAGG